MTPRYRLRLAVLWIAWFALLVALLILRTSADAFAGVEKEVWGWFLANIMPTVTLVSAVTGLTKASEPSPDDADLRPLFRLGFAMSVFYLLALSLPIVAQAFQQGDPMPGFQRANLWLGPLQGVVASTLGVFFAKSPTK